MKHWPGPEPEELFVPIFISGLGRGSGHLLFNKFAQLILFRKWWVLYNIIYV